MDLAFIQAGKDNTVRRPLLLIVMCLLMLVGGAVSATSPEELSGLAGHYPEDTTIFVSIRTDDAYIEQIDTIYSQILGLLPAEARRSMPPQFAPLLDLAAQGVTGSNFEQGVRSWLGNSIAVGMPLEMSLLTGRDLPVLIAVEITDKAAAIEILERLMEMDGADMASVEEGEFTVYVSENANDGAPVFAVGEDVMYLSTSDVHIPLTPVRSSLADSAVFNTAVDLLPGDDYNALIYLDGGSLQEFNLNVMAMSGQSYPPALARLIRATGSQIYGLTVMNDDTFVLDLATTPADMSIYEEFGMELMVTGAIDMDFASNIPADAGLVLQSADFGMSTMVGLQNIRMIGDYLSDNGGIIGMFESSFRMAGMRLSQEERAILETFATPETMMAISNISFSGLTGLSLERDVLPVLDGDFAMYLRAQPADDLPVLPMYPDGALLFQSSDTDGAKTMMDALIEASEAYDTGYAVEAYGEDGAALVFPLISDMLGFQYKPFDVLVAQDADLFAIGSRAAVEAATEAEATLIDDETFQAAQAYLLDGSAMIGFVNPAPLGELITEYIEAAGDDIRPRDREDLYAMRYLLSLIEHATLSSYATEDGSGIARMTITLAEEAMLPPGEN